MASTAAPEKVMDHDQLLELVKKRRSIRRFTPQPVSDELVHKIIEVARWAPSGANSQPWEFVVVRRLELRDRIVDIIAKSHEYSHQVETTREEALRHPGTSRPWSRPGYADAPVFILLLGDTRTKLAYPLLTYLTTGDGTFNSSLANAFLYMHLAAVSLGLGSQWVSATASPLVQPLIKHLLDIPQEMELFDTMALGYPAHSARPRLVREAAGLAHYERYDRARLRSGEEIKSFLTQLVQERMGRD